MSDDEDENETFEDPDKIDPFGENPGWSECWVKAHRINYLGRVKKTVLSLFSIWNFFRLSTLQYLDFLTLYSGEWHSVITTLSKF